MTAARSSPRIPAWLALAYLAFVLYGSLVPLDFHSLPLEEALARFRSIPYLDLGIGSRADWVANILLFIPLAFLWLGVLWHRWSAAARVLASLAVFLAAVGLSIGIEFTQLFFPPRTVSQNDIFAETLGAAIGVLAWWLVGPRLVRWVAALQAVKEPWDFTRRLLYAYLAGLLAYNVLPLDLTLSPVEIWHKWHQGRVIWIPFSGEPAQPAQAAYDLATDALIWAPVGFLWWRGSIGRTVRNVFLAALLVEFLQLWVYSRVSDVTDLLTAALGGWLGAWLAGRFRRLPGAAGRDARAARLPVPGAAWGFAALAWLAVLGAVFFYPFDFRFDRAFLAERAGGLVRVPFTAYYYGTEYRAATEVLHKLLFFAPLGVFLQWALRGPRASRWSTGLSLLLVALVAAAVEGIQLALPEKNADLTDWAIEFAGGALGALLAARGLAFARAAAAGRLAQPLGARRATWPERPGLFLPVLLGTLAGVLWAASRLSFVPYNVRELIDAGHPLLSALLLAVALLWVFGFPAYGVARCAGCRRALACLGAAFVLHGVIAWLLLRLAVPLESLHDIVGSPVLDWPWEWELIGRFLALFLLWSTAAFGAALLVLRRKLPALRAPLIVWFATLPFALGISYYFVVVQADTDNLTELLANHASVGAYLWLWAAILVGAVAGAALGSMLAAGFRQVGKGWGALLTLSPLLAYGALSQALEPYIVKYGQLFSALQFLLSGDRAHYAGPAELMLRYVLAHVALLLLAALSAAPFLGAAASAHARAADQPVRGQKQRGEVRPQQ
jgi:glycopeptide antibiotics resistance protein